MPESDGNNNLKAWSLEFVKYYKIRKEIIVRQLYDSPDFRSDIREIMDKLGLPKCLLIADFYPVCEGSNEFVIELEDDC